jgi:hypothetical protein
MLIVAGLIALGVGCFPWLALRFIPRKPYHYYYVAPEAMNRLYALLAVGVVLSLIGACILVRANRPGQG